MNNFMPHGHCFLWREDLLLLHVLSDAVIALSYFTIPAAIFYFLRKKQVRHRMVPALFIAFIVSCGLTHAVSIWNFWNANYWFSGGMKAMTAGISGFTAIMLWVLMPKALKLPTTEEMSHLNEQLQDANKDLEKKVQIRTQELSRLNQDLEHVLSMLSHDFRNGLNLIKGYTDLLGASQLPAEVKQYTEKLSEVGERLVAMVSDLSDVGRLNNLNYEEFSLRDVVRAVIEDLSSSTGVPIKSKIGDLPKIIGVESLIHQLFFNLVSNSIKYKKPGMPLEIEVSLVSEFNDRYVLHFKDNGIGVPEHETEKIFEMYMRGHHAIQSEIPGSGVGLGFCRKVCEIHGGEIVLESGKDGCVFSLILAKDASQKPT